MYNKLMHHESLLGEDDRQKELMNIPLNEILTYVDKSDMVEPEEALRYLADLFIINCGVSLSMRGFADYCSAYWIKKLDMDNNSAMRLKYNGAYTLGQMLPYLSDKYYDGLLDDFDSCAMTHQELRSTLFNQFEQTRDNRIRTILCAGIYHAIEDPNYGWLHNYPIEKIEEGIVNFHDEELIFHRVVRDRKKLLPKRNSLSPKAKCEWQAYQYSDEEVRHFIELNQRLVELQHEIMAQVKAITQNLQEQIENGYYQYEPFLH